MLCNTTIVLGGAASGKSQFAENLIENSGLERIYIATARVFDDETKFRVDTHLARRSKRWRTIDAQIELGAALRDRTADEAVLVDCATMWLTNLMMDDRDIDSARDDLLDALLACPAPVVVVSNEVGQGIVPDNALARTFREAQGRLNIALARQADTVVQVVAGLPNVLKGAP